MPSSSSSESKDSDALLRKDAVLPSCHQPIKQQQQVPTCHHRPWPGSNYVHNPQSSTSAIGSVSNGRNVPSFCGLWSSMEPTVDPAIAEHKISVGIAPHADLIELVLSSENVSLCDSTSSAEYKSCDEEGDIRRSCADRCSTPNVLSRHLPPTRSISADFAAVLGTASCSKQRCFSTSDFGGHDVEENVGEDDRFLPDEPFANVARLPQCSSLGQLSVASSISDPTVPTCRICHLTASDGGGLISPCRCSGTMQYIHSACLMKWLEVSNRKSKRPPSCELCLYQYHRHKKFRAEHWQFPQCSLRDKVLHIAFFLSLLTMIGAATVTVLCFKQEKGGRAHLDRNRLTHSEIVTLVCGVLFFFAFFLAMYVEVKAKSTIYKLIMDFMYLNQQWYIDEYDKKADIQTVAV